MKIFNKIKFAFQRAKKGFCDYDLYNIDDWFIEKFPKMLDEFMDCTAGTPANEQGLIEEVEKLPKYWVVRQKDRIEEILKRFDKSNKFDLNDGFCCWMLIILRLKTCIELMDEWNEDYDEFRANHMYTEINDLVENNKKEAFYLFEKYFFNLWW